MARSESSSSSVDSRSSSGSGSRNGSSIDREDKKKKKREKDSKRRSRSRSNNKKKVSSPSSKDKKSRSKKPSDSKERKKSRKRDGSGERKRKTSSRSRDRKKRSVSKDKRKKQDKSVTSSKHKRDRSGSSKRKRGDRSSSAHKKKDKSSRGGKSPRRSSVSKSGKEGQNSSSVPPAVELTEQQKKELELKKQRERLAKMRLLKFAAADDSSSEDDDDKREPQQQNPTNPQQQLVQATIPAVLAPEVVTPVINIPATVVMPPLPVAMPPLPVVPAAAAAAIPVVTSAPLIVEQQQSSAIIEEPKLNSEQVIIQIPKESAVVVAQQNWEVKMEIETHNNGQVKLEDNGEESTQNLIFRRGMEYVEDLIRQKQISEVPQTGSSMMKEEELDEDTRKKRLMYDSDGLEELSDDENTLDQESNGAGKEGSKTVKNPEQIAEQAAIDAEKRKKLQLMLQKPKEESDEFASSDVFGSSFSNNNSSNSNKPAPFAFAAPNPIGGNNVFKAPSKVESSGNGNSNKKSGINAGNGITNNNNNLNSKPSPQTQSTNGGFNSMKKQIPQQLTPDEDSEEDELDAYCRMLDEQLEKEKPTKKNIGGTSSLGTGAAPKKADDKNAEEEEEEEGPVNYITMEEIFGKKDDDEKMESSEDENDEFEMMKKRERMELEGNINNGNGEQTQQSQIKEEEENDEEDDDEHYKAFKEAMRKKKNELLKDHTGDLLMDDEQEIEEKTVMMETDTGENKEDYLERLKREAQKKDLKPVEYKLSDLEKFRKNFYIESKEITNMTEDEIKLIRENLGDIAVKGINVPRPIKSWYQSGLSDKILDVLIKKKKYEKPFPIQCQSLPVIMSGRDTIGIAETGSGKTLAYILPMIRHIADQRPLEEGDGPIGLILVPTRELATQIYMEARPFLKPYQFEIVAVYGGTGIQGQLSELKRGCEIVVCTPGRLFDVLTTSNGKITNLKRSTMVVIDEADRMFDLGFEPQIAKILATTRPDKQTVLFSATFPKNVELLARKLMKHKPVEIMVGARGQACTNITQIIEIRDEATRIYRLLELLGKFTEQGQVIIFVDKQIEVDQLYTQLRMQHYSPTVLHAGVDADDRTNNLMDFKKGIYRILIATSVSSRGIDVKNVVLVVNYRCPNHIEDYIHRIGRTGRAGKKGTAVTFLGSDEDKYSLDLIKVLKRSDQKVPLELLVMGEEFKKKLKSGEAKSYNNANMQGKGFNFDEDEIDSANKAKFEQKKFLALKMGIEIEDKLDEDDIFKKKSLDEEKAAKEKKSNKPELTFQQKLHIVLTQDEYKELREQMLSESSKVAVLRKNQGQGEDAIKKATEDIFRKGLENFKPTTKNVDIGKVEIAKMLQEFEKNNEDENNQNVAELVINDYPENVRKAITRKDFLERIYIQTGCTVLQRGVLVEMGKKVIPGFQKLFLRIEGDSRFKVTMAYKDIKQEAEERSIRMHERGQNQGGKFILP